ncbi:MAG TPA: GNAT family N-acetyltransferase [Candidatus Babeliaceae bacterium]|nr:GNAT family N-acetyltransferase [Candidatus Babeliaceae bacterium]
MSIFKLLALLFMATISTTMQANSGNYTIRTLVCSQHKELIPFVAEQRSQTFRNYPYLYQANNLEEYAYVNWLFGLPHSMITVVYMESKPIGFLIGTSFEDFDQHFGGSREIFLQAGLNPKNYYYFSEIIIIPEYRGQHIAQKLFSNLEQQAQALGYSAGCFVHESHNNHPLKPQDYQELDSFFQKLGYYKSPLTIDFTWPTITRDGVTILSHTLDYWLKEF